MKLSNYLSRMLGAFALILAAASVSPVFAIELDAAKQQGLVGETPAGYLAAVGEPSAEVKALVNKINSERRQRYEDIAAKNKTPVAAVEGLAGKKAIEITPKGQYIQTSSGEWKKK